MYLMCFNSPAEVETVFLPFLMEEMEKSLNKKQVARTLLDGRINNLLSFQC